MVEKRNLARRQTSNLSIVLARKIVDQLAREVQQEGSNFARLLREVNAADEIRPVLADRERGGFPVRGLC